MTSDSSSSSITNAQVEKLARLCCLSFTPSQLGVFTQQLNSILGYVGSLNNVPTTSPSSPHTSGVKENRGHPENVMREDEALNSLTTEQALEGAPDSIGGYFKVPLVIEEA